jgi:peptide/nickel transport system substrate-binding protein
VDEESVKAAKNYGKDPTEMIGTGPYTVLEWIPNDHYTLEYNPKYRGPEPSVKKLIVKVIPDPGTQNLMFQNGEPDLIDLGSLDSAIVQSAYRTAWADHIVSRSKVGLIFFGMNEANEYLADVKVRQAIGKAINVDELINGVYSGDAKRENGIIPSGIDGHNDSLEGFQYDPEGAKKLLEEAGYKAGEIHFELSLDSGMSSSLQLVYQAIAQNLQAVGINAEIKSYDHTSWLDRRNQGKMDAYIGRWLMDYNDPANIMVSFFGGASKSVSRSLNYTDTDIMDRVAKAPAILDDAKRIAEYQALEKKIIREDAAWIPLLSELHLYCTGKRVKSFTPQWAGFGDFYATDVVLN